MKRLLITFLTVILFGCGDSIPDEEGAATSSDERLKRALQESIFEINDIMLKEGKEQRIGGNVSIEYGVIEKYPTAQGFAENGRKITIAPHLRLVKYKVLKAIVLHESVHILQHQGGEKGYHPTVVFGVDLSKYIKTWPVLCGQCQN